MVVGGSFILRAVVVAVIVVVMVVLQSVSIVSAQPSSEPQAMPHALLVPLFLGESQPRWATGAVGKGDGHTAFS